MGFPTEVVIATEDNIQEYLTPGNLPENIGKLYSKQPLSKMEEAAPKVIEAVEEGGNYDYTFDTFIVGPSNNFAYAACKAVATQQPGSYNPLFIYGPSGLGKTHLLLAIASEVKKCHPEQNILSISSETFKASWQS